MPDMEDPDPRVILVIALAALTHAFNGGTTASQLFDDAESFVKEAELRYGSFARKP
jgi:hypothetical protein